MKNELPKIVSVDDHVVEPAHVWQTWLPEKHRALRPRIERRHTRGQEHVGGGAFKEVWADEGTPVDCWIYEDKLTMVHRRMFAAVGFPRDEMEPLPMIYDEMRAGCYEPKARLDDMDVNWVEASLCFPTFPRFCGQTFLEAKDRELAPVTFCEIPPNLGLPSIHSGEWDPLSRPVTRPAPW